MSSNYKHKVAILGATGIVGQKAIALLKDHNSLEINELTASSSRIGQKFSESTTWHDPTQPLCPNLANTSLKGIDQIDSELIISCLPASYAKDTEQNLQKKGHIVFSNASAHRMHTNVPILIPEVNSAHLELLNKQTSSGKIITNSNCVAAILAPALAPLAEIGSFAHINAVTMQSISGAGKTALSSPEFEGNIIPHIQDEAEKIVQETNKILGKPDSPLNLPICVQVNRVPTLYGHMIALQVTFQEPTSIQSALEIYRNWNKKHPNLFQLHDRVSRPQPKKDLTHDDMRIHIGQLKQFSPTQIGLTILGNNLVRGAAGAAIANIEAYLKWKGLN